MDALNLEDEDLEQEILGYELPEGFLRWPRSKRLKWHTARHQRESKVCDFMASLESGLPTSELRLEIRRLKEYNRVLKTTLIIRTSEEYPKIKIELNRAILQIKILGSKRAKILVRQIRSRSETNEEQRELIRLKDEEIVCIDQATDIENRIRAICRNLKIDPLPLLRLHTLND